MRWSASHVLPETTHRLLDSSRAVISYCFLRVFYVYVLPSTMLTGDSRTNDNSNAEPEASQASQTQQPTSSDGEKAPASPAKRNDNSNPQQGTSSRGARVAAQSHQSAEAAAPTALVSSFPRPQQPILQRPSLKIPPTKKDDRKLFVGGLPSDGKFLISFLCDDGFRVNRRISWLTRLPRFLHSLSSLSL